MVDTVSDQPGQPGQPGQLGQPGQPDQPDQPDQNASPDQADALLKAEGRRPRRGLLTLLPLVAFVGLALIFIVRLGAGDPSRLPSALIDKPVPEFSLPGLSEAQPAGFSSADLADGVHVVNVWASWCAPCRAEHPILMQLSSDERYSLIGLNYKDNGENARRFLGTLGDPYDKVGVDRRGRTAIDWGVYGVPETFIVADGLIVHKFVGPLSPESLASDFMPALQEALAGQTKPAS